MSWLVALKWQFVCDIDRIDSVFYDRFYAGSTARTFSNGQQK